MSKKKGGRTPRLRRKVRAAKTLGLDPERVANIGKTIESHGKAIEQQAVVIGVATKVMEDVGSLLRELNDPMNELGAAIEAGDSEVAREKAPRVFELVQQINDRLARAGKDLNERTRRMEVER